jgi:hypothetical protein
LDEQGDKVAALFLFVEAVTQYLSKASSLLEYNTRERTPSLDFTNKYLQVGVAVGEHVESDSEQREAKTATPSSFLNC